MPQAERTVVIGAGLGGLYAASYLAHHGVATTLLEKNTGVGGLAGELSVNGFRFDIGATMLQTPKVLHEAFGALGRRTEDHLDLVPLDPIYRLVFHDGIALLFGRSVEETARAIGSISPPDREGFLRYMKETERLKRDLKTLFVGKGIIRPRDLLSSAAWNVFRRLNPFGSVKSRIHRLFRDQRLRDAFSIQVLYFGTPPDKCSSVYSMVPFFEITQGVWHLKGGISSLARSLAKVFSESGGELRTSAAVRRIELRDGRVVGVTLDTGERLDANVIVSNADALYTYQTLLAPGTLRPRFLRRLKRAHLSCSSHLILLELHSRAHGLLHHNFYLPSDSKKAYHSIFNDGAMPTELAAYVCMPTATDPTMAPPGRHALYVLSPAPRRLSRGSWKDAGESVADDVLAKLEARGVHGLRALISNRHVLTPTDFETSFNVTEGMTFGLQARLGQMGPLRPKVRSPDVQGLFLAGASVHPGAGIPLVLSSGRRAGEEVMAYLGGR